MGGDTGGGTGRETGGAVGAIGESASPFLKHLKSNPQINDITSQTNTYSPQKPLVSFPRLSCAPIRTRRTTPRMIHIFTFLHHIVRFLTKTELVLWGNFCNSKLNVQLYSSLLKSNCIVFQIICLLDEKFDSLRSLCISISLGYLPPYQWLCRFVPSKRSIFCTITSFVSSIFMRISKGKIESKKAFWWFAREIIRTGCFVNCWAAKVFLLQ